MHDGGTNRDDVRRWVDRYEEAWRTAGTQSLAGLFTDDSTYLVSPWAAAVTGLTAIAELWEAERDGPDEGFTMTGEVLAVEGTTAVVRVEVDYERDRSGRWRDLWVLTFEEDGPTPGAGSPRCRAFEEWPFAPGPSDGR